MNRESEGEIYPTQAKVRLEWGTPASLPVWQKLWWASPVFFGPGTLWRTWGTCPVSNGLCFGAQQFLLRGLIGAGLRRGLGALRALVDQGNVRGQLGIGALRFGFF